MAGTIALGLGAGIWPRDTILVLFAGLALLLVLRAPIWILPAAALAAFAISAVVRVEWFASGSSGSALLLGQGRVALGVATVALYRATVSQRGFAVHRGFLAIAGVFALGIVVSALVATARGSNSAELLQVVERQLSWIIAGALIGVVAAEEHDRGPQTFRALALVGIVVSLSSVAYWMWVTGRLEVYGVVGSIFENVLFDERLTVPIEASRSRFPFVDQHPNFNSIIFTSIVAIGCPPLLSSGSSRDRALAFVLLGTAVAGVMTTQSRTGFVAILLVGLGLAVLTPGLSSRVRRASLAIAVTVGLFASLVLIAAFPEDRTFTSDQSGLGSRQLVWSEALEDFEDAPLLGKGFDFSARASYGTAQESVHSEFLGRLVDGGIFGLGTLLLALGGFVFFGWQLLRAGGAAGSVGAGTLLFTGTLLLSMTVGATWVSSATLAILSWMVLAMASSTLARHRNSSP